MNSVISYLENLAIMPTFDNEAIKLMTLTANNELQSVNISVNSSIELNYKIQCMISLPDPDDLPQKDKDEDQDEGENNDANRDKNHDVAQTAGSHH
jgi:hypothetical protein